MWFLGQMNAISRISISRMEPHTPFDVDPRGALPPRAPAKPLCAPGQVRWGIDKSLRGILEACKPLKICHHAFRHQGPSYNAFTIPDSVFLFINDLGFCFFLLLRAPRPDYSGLPRITLLTILEHFFRRCFHSFQIDLQALVFHVLVPF